ncbi:SdrD B-like domain-containing protein [Pseudovibrio sp. Tun.PSC04-5.I4]|uniref:DUF7507 domain-containing protein n=1 Tax=Pseudovibrio sp. Tun.PSC04-5.I4 TaxID=1798213 RepID=UPI000B804502|nr:SdrD B-like domain-containing protein [Pseudovibrio sp. Tun.PSC04-5.I4]
MHRVLASVFAGLFLVLSLLTTAAHAADTYDWSLDVTDVIESTSSASIPAGSFFPYQIKVGNNPTDGENRTTPETSLIVNVPETIQLVEAGPLTCNQTLPVLGPITVACVVPTLTPLDALEFEMVFRSAVKLTSSLTVNTSFSIPTGDDPEPLNNTHTEPTTIAIGPGIPPPTEPDDTDLELTVTGPATAPTTSSVTYEFTVTNNGPDVIRNWALELPDISGLQVTSTPSGCTQKTGKYYCNSYSSIANGGTATLNFTGKITEPLSAGDSFTVIGKVIAISGDDSDLDNNTASTATEVTAGTDVSISLTSSTGSLAVSGEPNTMTIKAKYTGDVPGNLVIHATIPAIYGISASSWTSLSGGWTCTLSAREFTCLRANTGLSSGASVELGSIVIEIPVPAHSGQTPVSIADDVETEARISPIDEADPAVPDLDLSNNIATLTQDVERPNVTLTLSKSASEQLVIVGQPYTYDLSVGNTGNTKFSGRITITDTLPVGVKYTGYSDSDPVLDWVCPNGPLDGSTIITCYIDYDAGVDQYLAKSGSTPTLTFDVKFTSDGYITNSADVTTADWPTTDTAEATVRSFFEEQTADLTVYKSATRGITGDPSGPLPTGGIQTFTLEVVNQGFGADKGGPSEKVILTDLLSDLLNDEVSPTDLNAGFIDISVAEGSATRLSGSEFCSLNRASATSQNLRCEFETLPVCTKGVDCPVVTVRVRPGAGTNNATTLSNTAKVSSAEVPDLVGGNFEATVSYETAPRTDIDVAITSDQTNLIAGEQYYFYTKISNPNSGRHLNTAENVVVTQILPHGIIFKSVSGGDCSATTLVANEPTESGKDTLICNVGAIPSGSYERLSIYFETVEALVDQTLTTSATVATDTPNIATGVPTPPVNDYKAALTVTQIGKPDYDIYVDVSDEGTVDIGSETTYSIKIKNSGPSFAEQVTITFDLPDEHLSYQSHELNNLDADCSTIPAVDSVAQQLVCKYPRVDDNSTELMEVTVKAIKKGTASTSGTLTSTGITSNVDTNSANNTEAETTTVVTRVDGKVVSKIPSLSVVDQEEDFDYTVQVQFDTAVEFQEADDVVVKDTLPSNMYFKDGAATVPVVTITPSGAASQNICTIAANARSFECAFGTVQKGPDGGTSTKIEIQFPVYADNITSFPRTLSNTARFETTSRDVNSANNAATGDVKVVSSSIAGAVFMDFNKSGEYDGDDKAASGIVVRLTGKNFKNEVITAQQTTTTSSGAYSFTDLQRGTYSVTYDDIAANRYLLKSLVSLGTVQKNEDSTQVNTSGTPAYTLNDNSVSGSFPTNMLDIKHVGITDINLTQDAKAVEYNFALISQARVGLALDEKSSSILKERADGSFTTQLIMRIENFSEEPVESVSVALPLAGPSALLGNFESPSDKLNGVLTNGSYTITQAPANYGTSCGRTDVSIDPLQSVYNGDDQSIILNGASIPAKSTCAVAVHVRVQPERPVTPAYPSPYSLQGKVVAEGHYSDQIGGTFNLLEDLSYHGSNPDPDGDHNPTNEDLPTPIAPQYISGIALKMSAVTSWGSLGRAAVQGDTITYGFDGYVRNNANKNKVGNIIQNNATITEVTVANVDDLSAKTSLVLVGTPEAELLPKGAATPLNYTAIYTVTQDDIESGRVVASSKMTAQDVFGFSFEDISGTAPTNDTPLETPLTPEPKIALKAVVTVAPPGDRATTTEDKVTYSYSIKNTGNVILKDVLVTDPRANVEGLSSIAIAQILPDQVIENAFTASYPVIQTDLDALQITNSAKVGAKTVGNATVNDLAGTDYDNDGPIVTPLQIAADIELVLTSDTSGLSQSRAVAGETLIYNYAVTNTGNVTLTNVTIQNSLGVVLTGGPIILAPNATDTGSFVSSYVLLPADITAESVSNTATTTGEYGSTPVKFVQDPDSLTTSIVFIEAKSEAPFLITTDGGTTTDILASDLIGTSPATLANGILTYVSGAPELTLDTLNAAIVLTEGNPAGSYQLTYQICRKDSPTVCAQATETVIQEAINRIEATVTQVLSDNGDGIDGLGDTNTYRIAVENKGNTSVETLSLSDTFETLELKNGLVLDRGPDFDEASENSPEGTLKQGEFAYYDAHFALTVPAVDGGGLSYHVLARAHPKYPAAVSGTPADITDLSDDGDDLDLNKVDDPTQLKISAVVEEASLRISKVTPRTVVTRGAVVPYTLKIVNTLPVPAGPIDLIDILPADFVFVEGTAKLDGIKVTPDVENRMVTFPDLKVSPYATVVVTLSARILITADVGEHTNVGRLRNSETGELLGRQATASVSILPEHVFDCGDVYGKVFNDRNRDGYQNPPQGKVVETGISSVRLTGVDGTIITSDEYGRFHVACAMLPKDRGSNFILKLDTRTLPTGFRVTTENPRVVRLTPGKMTELNFGAAQAPVTRIGLNRSGFTTNGLSPALQQALQQMAKQVTYSAVHFELKYHYKTSLKMEGPSLALRRMELVETYLEMLWKENSGDILTFEKTISKTKS